MASCSYKGTPRDASVVQNGFGAQFQQVVYTWLDREARRIELTKYSGSTDSSSLYFSTAADRALINAPKAKGRDL